MEEKEHVTKYFYNNYKNFSIINLRSKSKKKSISMTVDTKKDLVLLQKNFILKRGIIWKLMLQ